MCQCPLLTRDGCSLRWSTHEQMMGPCNRSFQDLSRSFKHLNSTHFSTILFPHYLIISDHYPQAAQAAQAPGTVGQWSLPRPSEACDRFDKWYGGSASCGMWKLVQGPKWPSAKSWNRKVGRRETIFDNSWIISFETYVSRNLFMSPWLPFLGSWMGCQGSGGKVGGDPNGNMGSTSGHWLLWKF